VAIASYVFNDFFGIVPLAKEEDRISDDFDAEAEWLPNSPYDAEEISQRAPASQDIDG
jgi:hypothetical protein